MSIPMQGLSHKLTFYLADQSWRCDVTKPGTAQIVMLRGCRINADKSLSVYGNPLKYTNHYDDVIVVYGIKRGGLRYSGAYPASSKPGREWIRHSSYAGSYWGCPTVQPGQYRYVRGHHYSHQAMRQAAKSPVCVIRDVNQNAQLELSDMVDYPMTTGINIHAGGVSNIVGWNSSGCQVVRGGWSGNAWREFRNIIYNVAVNQDIFHYTVADFREFGKWHDAPAKERRSRSYLRFGSHGDRVVNLQKRLAKAGYYGSAFCDGDFGRMTDEGLRAYQNTHNMWPTGVATPTMMEDWMMP